MDQVTSLPVLYAGVKIKKWKALTRQQVGQGEVPGSLHEIKKGKESVSEIKSQHWTWSMAQFVGAGHPDKLVTQFGDKWAGF